MSREGGLKRLKRDCCGQIWWYNRRGYTQRTGTTTVDYVVGQIREKSLGEGG
jgi:hypothetical protein